MSSPVQTTLVNSILLGGCAAAIEVESQPARPQAQLCIQTQEGKVLIAAEEIIGYDWQTHTLTLQPAVRPRLLSAFHRGLLGNAPFVVAVDGESCYQGRRMSTVMSMSRSTPVIVVDAHRVDKTLGEN